MPGHPTPERAAVTDRREPPDPAPARALSVYLLGTIGFDALQALQRRLAFDVSGDRDTAALVVCEHPTGITIGRAGSAAHVRPNPRQLAARGWPVNWVARGGGALLHLPGQVACYPVLPLDALGLSPGRYVRELVGVAVELGRAFGADAAPDFERPGARARGRRFAAVGASVRAHVTGFGLVANAHPDLAPFREVRCDGDPLPMTSLARESPHRVRLTAVRQRLVELVAARFAFDRVSVFHTHPALLRRHPRHALPHGS